MSLNLSTIVRDSAHHYPDKVAIICGDTRFNYEQLHSDVQRFAGALKQCGVGRGQHVALLLPNVPQFTIAYFAAHYLGAPVVPLNCLLKAEEIAYHLNDSDSVVLVVWDGLLEQARPGFDRSDTCKKLIVAGSADGPGQGADTMDSLMDGVEPVSDLPDTNADDTAVLLYTSGTTGRPKGAELTHFNMFYNAEVAGRLCPVTKATVSLGVLPFFHSFGQTVIQNNTLKKGGTVVLLPRFEPQAALETMSSTKVTYFAGVPTMYFALLHHEGADAFDLSSLDYCMSGGAAMPVEVMKTFDEKYGVNILEGYGLSETSPVASFNVLDQPKKAGSIGRPIEGIEFRLVTDDGKVIVGPGAPGEICIKGHNVMKGYYKRPEATAESIQNGWFHTGDIAQRDENGYYFIVDRKKDMIVRGGYNVYPREIEEFLYAHPAVAEAAVVGIAKEGVGEEVKAILVLRKEGAATEQEIIDYCRDRLAAYKYPRIVEFRNSLPKGPTGKILKRELRD